MGWFSSGCYILTWNPENSQIQAICACYENNLIACFLTVKSFDLLLQGLQMLGEGLGRRKVMIAKRVSGTALADRDATREPAQL